MAKPELRLTSKEKGAAIEKLKAATVLQYTFPGVPCVYYGDENGQEGYIDPFCRQCFSWDNLNEELIAHYKKLGEIRNEYSDIFKDGIYQEIFAKDGCILFRRKKSNREIYVYVNRSQKKFSAKTKGEFKNLFNQSTVKDNLEIPEYSFGIFLKK
jgi:glycosidase